jgi:8-oxo-dGTP diphosphatase
MNTSVATIVMRDGKVFVARRAFGGPLGGLWEFPGGKLEEGESEEEALVREFDEEFSARLVPLRRLGETSFMNRGRDRLLAAWLAELSPGESPRLNEHQSFDWVGLEALEALELADSDRKLLGLIRPLFT